MAVRDKDVSFKTDGSPVTQADRAAEEILLEALACHAPSIPVISEENAASHHLPVAPDYSWWTRLMALRNLSKMIIQVPLP